MFEVCEEITIEPFSTWTQWIRINSNISSIWCDGKYGLLRFISIDINLWYCIILFSCLDDLVYVYMEKEEKIQGYCKWKNCMFIYFCLVIKGCHQLIFAIFKDFTWWSSHVLKAKHNKISSFFHHEQKVLYISRWK